MKKILALIIILIASYAANAQNWINISSSEETPAEIKLVTSDIQNSIFEVSISGFGLKSISTPVNNTVIPVLQNSSRILQAGAPDLPKLNVSLIIPDNAEMSIDLINSEYIDYPNIDIAPSKGNLLRDVDPATVPFNFGSTYNQNAFYPGNLTILNSPYIFRDFRGQAAHIFPFQYNPVTKVLRVYTKMLVHVYADPSKNVQNAFQRNTPLTSLNKEFSNIYENHFINYNNNYKYTPLTEQGKMLVICYGQFMTAMQDFVNWKNDIGIPTEIINVSTAGATAAAIKTYVTNYYNTNGLTFLLLVGDAAQIPTFTVSGGGSDNTYAYITGSDHYQEFIVGRFSAENETHVNTQVKRTIAYEKNPSLISGLYNSCMGIASSQGPGDDNEYDYQHIRNIHTDLLSYTYTTAQELFDGSQGGLDATGDPTAAMVATGVNNGVGIINYTGHGSDVSWGSSGFSSTNISNLTNTHAWPFIWSVACVNGNFTSGTCFAESWLRQLSNNLPAGAVATLMSTINQSWDPPMDGQDEMNDILIESYSNNIKRTFGGLSINGINKMNDTYGDWNMTDTWTIFGDPSLMVRTDNPLSMTVSHSNTVMLGETQLPVNCNINGAFVCLTINHQIIGTGTVVSGVANISFASLTTTDSITVTVTAFNRVPYIGKVAVLSILYPDDAEAFNVIDPANVYNCSGLSVQPKMILRNMGSNILTSCNVNCKFNGNTSTINWTGTLQSFESDTITFSAIILPSGSHGIEFTTNQPNGQSDSRTSNDTLKRTIVVNNYMVSSAFSASVTDFCAAPATVQFTNQSQHAISYLWDFGDGTSSTDENPTHTFNGLGEFTVTLTANAGVCGNAIHFENDYITVGADMPQTTSSALCNNGSTTLYASGNGVLKWYDAISGGTMINTGPSYTTPVLNATTTYYVQNELASPVQYLGPTNDTTNGGSLNYEHYLVFDCYTPTKLISVEVNATGSKNRTIALRNSSGATIKDTTINISAGRHRITLNFNIPVDNNLRLVGVGSPDLFRTNVASALSYPYEIGGVLSVKESSASQNPTGYYYYFYGWEVQPQSCISAREPVTAYVHFNAPDAGFAYSANGLQLSFTDQSVNAVSYQWSFGDGNSSQLANPVNNYSTAGTYNVKQVVNNACGTDSSIVSVQVTPSGISENILFGNINIYPNPVTDKILNIVIDQDVNGLSVLIYDILGNLVDIVWNSAKDKPSPKHLEYNTAKLNAGIYYMVFRNDSDRVVKKLIITD